MNNKNNYHIVIIGAGNLAYHLAPALKNAGHTIIQVYSRTKESAALLAKNTEATHTTDLKSIDKNADIYFFTLPDHALSVVVKESALKNKLLVTTSGSASTDVFKPFTSLYGVFYPLQTFSKDRPVNFTEVPVFIESANRKTETALFNLGMQISSKVTIITTEQRSILHLAAVFAGNFSNHMYVIAGMILKADNMSFDYLKPLISETASKILQLAPEKAQTGPAKRKDTEILKKHLKLLSGLPEFQKIYSFVSESIQKAVK